ncbi:uncharacterized protein isoform X3 [Leptinotarsa decemlineata]|uniref:uncharacterized protein isoform X3 n=1 Tax=Leptinotarsa decemlineata TaxID=7539 RepID=UPI003D3076D7
MDTVEVDDTEHLVNKYFAYGFSQKDILAYLKFLHNKCISARTLKRILSRLKLYRRKNYSRIENVVNFLRQEITKSGQLQGYIWMHLRCIQNNLVFTQDIVRELLWLLDPEGVETRKRKRLRRRQYFNKGPNYLWHVDSYDKLKPFGICINGCIDRFSHIIWLRAGITSSDPKAQRIRNLWKITKFSARRAAENFLSSNRVDEIWEDSTARVGEAYNVSTAESYKDLRGINESFRTRKVRHRVQRADQYGESQSCNIFRNCRKLRYLYTLRPSVQQKHFSSSFPLRIRKNFFFLS